MKEKQIPYPLALPFQLLLALSLTSFVFLISCNNSGEKTETPDTPQAPATQLQEQAQEDSIATLTSVKFPVLYIEWETIVTHFTDATVGLRRKIVFRFDFDGTASQPTLSGYPAKANGKYTSNTAPLLTLRKATTMTPITINTPFYLGNIELSQDEFRELRNGTPLTYLVFIPVKSTVGGLTNVVTYYTRWSATEPTDAMALKPYAVGDELNPSPPRDPQ